jgi:hypothetical protein
MGISSQFFIWIYVIELLALPIQVPGSPVLNLCWESDGFGVARNGGLMMKKWEVNMEKFTLCE